MISHLRNNYNSSFTEEKYNSFLKFLDSEFNYHIEYRIAETPVFIPKDFLNEILKASDEILATLDSKDFREYSEKALPDKFRVPDEDRNPLLLSLDFAVCKDSEGKLIPQLIELQGFATLYCYQHLLNTAFRKFFSIDDSLTNYFSGLNEDTYISRIKEVIVGDSDPENVILLDIEPEKQKTYIDFLCTEKYLGVKPVCITEVIRRKNKLFYKKDGKEIPVNRIYNRVINDELEKRNDIKYDFNFTDDIDVKWVAHPNWFFKISKYSLPFFKNKYVPETKFLNEYVEFPDDTENYVLKPLYSFAGAGVKFDLKKSDLESISENEKQNYILQRKINYEPVISTPESPAKAELRLLYLWEDKPVLVNNLVRLSKGKMMGVDFNKEKTWVGSSIAYYEK